MSHIYDYHTLNTGSAAEYRRSSLINDIYNILDTFRPQTIFVTSEFDNHNDHKAVYKFVNEEILQLKSDKNYRPILNESVVHGENDASWPTRIDINNPVAVPFTNPFPSNNVPLYWNNAKKIQLSNVMLQHKFAAIGAYASQNLHWSDYNYSFYKSDEFYWTKNYKNIAGEATITVSSENISTGQVKENAVDGYIAGYDMDQQCYHNEWVTNGELNGAWIQLDFNETRSINQIILNDRVTTVDNVKQVLLSFSDNSSFIVYDIPSDGTDKVINFNTKNVSWVKVTVISAEGYNAGLTEIQIMEV